MPLYEYQCNACGHRFEIIQKFSDEPVRICPQCGGEVTKLISSPAIQFKGTGWYITDYARKDQSASGGESRKSTDAESGAKSARTEGSAGSGQSSPASDSSSSGSKAATPAASSSKDS